MRTIQEVDQRIAEMKEELEKLERERYRLSEENKSYFVGIRYEDNDWSSNIEFKRFGYTTEDKVIDWVNAGNEQEDNDWFPYITYEYRKVTKEQNSLFCDFECIYKMLKIARFNDRVKEVRTILEKEFEDVKEEIDIKNFTGHHPMDVGMIND